VQKSLKDRHVAPADNAETPEEIEDVVWKWAVARWLVAEGMDVDAFPRDMETWGAPLAISIHSNELSIPDRASGWQSAI